VKVYATRQGVYSAVDANGRTAALIVNTERRGRWHVYRVRRGRSAAGQYVETWRGRALADVTRQLHGAQYALVQAIEKAIS
jgi:hypothetical protein